MTSERTGIALAIVSISFAIQGCEMAAPTTIDEPFAPSVLAAPPATAGRIVVNHDEWTLSEMGFAQAPDAGQFALSVASWFTGGLPGNFLVYSDNFGLTQNSLSTVMSVAHIWDVRDPVTEVLPPLDPFDAVFVAGNNVDNQSLIDYVNGGGNVYVAGGTGRFSSPQAEADAWNTFLNAFGLHFEAPFNGVRGTLPITSVHPIFTGVSALYQNNGNSVSEIDPTDPNTDILEFAGEHGLYGVFELMAPPNMPPVADAGTDVVIECVGVSTSVMLDGSGSIDPDGDDLTYTWLDSAGNVVATGINPSITLALGMHVITLVVSDGALDHTDDVAITIVDTVAPDIDLVLHERRLWSRHYKLRLVASVSASDLCDLSPTLVVTVTRNRRKYDGRHDDGHMDWKVVDNGDGTFDVFIRATRGRRRPRDWHYDNVGVSMNTFSSRRDRDYHRRTYTIIATATDASGNTSTVTTDVSVGGRWDEGSADHDEHQEQ